MNHKVPISSSVFERLELSVQKTFVSRSNGLSYPFKSAVRTARAIRSKKIVSLWNGSSCPVQKNLSTFPAICWKNKTVTSSFHWKVKCCERSLCGDVFMSFRKYCRGMSQLRSTQLFTRAKTFHRVEYSWLLTATVSHHD